MSICIYICIYEYAWTYVHTNMYPSMNIYIHTHDTYTYKYVSYVHTYIYAQDIYTWYIHLHKYIVYTHISRMPLYIYCKRNRLRGLAYITHYMCIHYTFTVQITCVHVDCIYCMYTHPPRNSLHRTRKNIYTYTCTGVSTPLCIYAW